MKTSPVNPPPQPSLLFTPHLHPPVTSLCSILISWNVKTRSTSRCLRLDVYVYAGF